jgi:DNA-binding beta-propeller fold protein YncE
MVKSKIQIKEVDLETIKTELLAVYGSNMGVSGEMEFNNPSALATDCQGSLIVCDSGNHRILKIDRTGKLVWIAGGVNANAQPRSGTAPTEFYSPRAMCTDQQNNIYVCDSLNCRVKKYSPEGHLEMMFGSQGNDEGQFGGVGPEGIDVDDDGLIFVADSHTICGGNHRVQVFDPGGHFVSSFGSYGTTDYQFAGSVPIREYGFDFGPGISPGPEGPVGIALLRNPINRYFSYFRKNTTFCCDTDNGRILVMTQQGENFGVIGKGIVYRPRQITIDSNDNIFVSDIHAHTPVWDSTNINKEYSWKITPNCSWVWAFARSGKLIGRVGSPEVHEMFDHEGAGLHWHGDGISIDKSDDHILYIQGHNLVFKLGIYFTAVNIPSGGIPERLGKK